MSEKILFLFLLLNTPFLAYPETIKFKNGKMLDAKIIERTKDFIKVDISSIPITYYFDEIEDIDGNKTLTQQKNSAASFKDKAWLVNKIRDALKGARYLQIESRGEAGFDSLYEFKGQQYNGVMKMEFWEKSNIALDEKIIESIFQMRIKEWPIEYMNRICRVNMEQILNQARAYGAPDSKIKQAEAMLDKFERITKSMTTDFLDRLLEAMKNFRYYFCADTAYLNFNSRWVKYKLPQGEKLWAISSAAQKESIIRDNIVNNIDREINLMSNRDGNDNYQCLWDTIIALSDNNTLFEVSEGTFEGQECYVLEILSEKLINEELVKELRKASSIVKTIDLSGREIYISKKDYLPIAYIIPGKMDIVGQGYPLERERKIFSFTTAYYHYAEQRILLPAETESAILVSDQKAALESPLGTHSYFEKIMNDFTEEAMRRYEKSQF